MKFSVRWRSAPCLFANVFVETIGCIILRSTRYLPFEYSQHCLSNSSSHPFNQMEFYCNQKFATILFFCWPAINMIKPTDNHRKWHRTYFFKMKYIGFNIDYVFQTNWISPKKKHTPAQHIIGSNIQCLTRNKCKTDTVL